MYELLDAFKEVILNIGSSHDRSTKAALCVAEGLLIVSWIEQILLYRAHNVMYRQAPLLTKTPLWTYLL